MAKFGEICRKRVFGFLPLYKERKAIHVVGGRPAGPRSTDVENVFSNFSDLREKEEKSFILREVYQKITRKTSIK